MKKAVIIFLTAAILLQLSGCLTKKADTDESQSEEVKSSVSSSSTDSDISDFIPTDVETADISTRDMALSPFDFPYDTNEIGTHLEDYAEGLGMVYNGTITLADAKSITKIQTREAASGDVLKRWCEDEIDDALLIARSCGISANNVHFCYSITKSAKYDYEYDITILAKY